MALKLRILLQNDEFVSAASSTEELLKALLSVQAGSVALSQEEEDSLRGWLLLRAQELEKGEIAAIDGQPAVSIGKSADGRPFVRDVHGDWPPVKPEF